MDPAEQRARDQAGALFDTLPPSIQQIMIAAQQALIDAEEREKAQEKALEEALEREEEQRVRLSELEVLEQEEAARVAYRERQARGFARTQAEMRASGIVERIGESQPAERNRLVRAEEGRIDISSEFASNEPHPQTLIQGANLLGFRRETIVGMIPQMQELWNSANAHEVVERSATGYMLFHIWTGNTRRSGTRVVALSDDDMEGDIDELFEALKKLLDDIERVKSAYQYIFEGAEQSYVHFQFHCSYYPSPRDVSNWGNNIQPIEKRACFNIFTASDQTVPCTVQVARRLWGPDAEESTVEEIVARLAPNVCIVKPYTGVKRLAEIKDYSDLVVELNSPVSSLNVIYPRVTYLLHFNEHIGVLEDMQEQKRRVTATSFRPVQQFADCKKVTMCFDIECYFDPEGEQKHTPYLCCACFVYDDVPGNVMEFEGKDCIAQMLDFAADNVAEFGLKTIELIAHNGGGYDFHYLLTSVADPSVIKDPLVRNNDFITFKFKHCNVDFVVKDSLNFLGCSLKKAADAFLEEADGKTDFPHHEVKTEEDLQRTFQEWLSVTKEWSVSVEKEKMVVQATHVINYSTSPECRKLIDWCKEYCVNDVIVLAKVWIKFKALVQDVFECEIVDQTHTLAGMSFRLFEANLPVRMTPEGPKVKLEHPKKKDFDNMREALIGGRCISVNGLHKNVACLDVKSLYPAAMSFYDQPYGGFRKVCAEEPSELGIYYCRVAPVAVTGHGFFPLRRGKEVSYVSDRLEPFESWYTSVDMDIGRQEGHSVTPIVFDTVHVGYSWKHKGKIFAQYIEGVLYKLKLKYERLGLKQHRQIIKIVMNSLWGKFAQKWMEDKYKVMSEENCDFRKDECHKIWDTDWFLVKQKQNRKWASKPVQNGVFTLSWARYHMFKLWNAVVIPGTVCLYSDTDSMMVLSSEIKKDAVFELNGVMTPVIGDEMGQLEIENVFHDLLTVGKKQYMGSYGSLTKLEYKKRFKGIPQEFIRPEMYTHLLKSKDHTVQVHFLKFKREWGCVQGYVERKTVRQT